MPIWQCAIRFQAIFSRCTLPQLRHLQRIVVLLPPAEYCLAAEALHLVPTDAQRLVDPPSTRKLHKVGEGPKRPAQAVRGAGQPNCISHTSCCANTCQTKDMAGSRLQQFSSAVSSRPCRFLMQVPQSRATRADLPPPGWRWCLPATPRK